MITFNLARNALLQNRKKNMALKHIFISNLSFCFKIIIIIIIAWKYIDYVIF